MNNITTTISFSIFSNKGVYALLLGSGISKNSGIPTGWNIVVDLIQKLAELKNEKCAPSPEEWFRLRYDEEPNYSNILAKLIKSPSERVNFLKQYFEPTEDEIEQGLKLPTKSHKHIASLIKKGYIKVVITTNFDRLLEKALQAENIEPIVIRHPNDIDGAMPLVHSDFILVKINGDYLDTRFLNTEEELSVYDKKTQEYILRIINEFGIISCGWSAKWDIGLLNVLRQSENFRFSSYWTHLGKCESELKEIAKKRKGETVQIKDSDTFFGELADKILALENIKDNHPLTPDIAIARLKRYIVKDDYKILLHDLFQNQLNDLMSKIRTKDDASLYPDNASLFPVILHYINCFEELIPLIIEGVYWSKEEHNYLFTKILKQISYPQITKGRSYEATVSLQYFPALLALYTIGISALIKQNFTLLNTCFNLKIDESDYEYSDTIFLIDKVHPCIVESRLMNSILSMNLKTPISTFLCQTLKPHFTKGSLSEKEFDEIFDVFEYFLSLNYYFLVEPKWGNNWAPWGQYHWRNYYSSRGRTNLLTTMLTESEKLQEDWLPIKQGMFGGSYENFSNAKTKLTEFLKKIFLH